MMGLIPGAVGDAVVGDTETTGFDPDTGDRIVEIGLIRIRNMIRTGERLHIYINPERDIPQEAVDVHGIDNARVAGCPVFADVAERVGRFMAGSKFIAHNANFDVKFLNSEFERAGYPEFVIPQEDVVDSLAVFKRSHPTSPSSLDALCRRYKIDNGGRDFHGALLDAELLTDVWLAMNGGAQMGMTIPAAISSRRPAEGSGPVHAARQRPGQGPVLITADEIRAHAAFLEKNGLASGLWLDNIRRVEDNEPGGIEP